MIKIWFISLTACIVLSGCISWNRGLEPIQPKYSSTSWTEKVDTLKPRLEWKPYKNASVKQDFRYQLQIVDGNVVRLFKDGIHDSYYVVDEPLLPNKEYQWAVRAAWTSNGRTEGENWNDKKYFYLSPILFGWGSKPYKILTPNVVPYSNHTPKLEVTVEQPKAAVAVDDSAKKKDTLESKALQTRATSTDRDDAVNLEKLNNLNKKGIINDEEYSKKKKEILDRM